MGLTENREALKFFITKSMARLLAWKEFKADVITSLLNECLFSAYNVLCYIK